MTGHKPVLAVDDNEKRAREVDAEGWLGKPFGIDDLLAAFSRVDRGNGEK